MGDMCRLPERGSPRSLTTMDGTTFGAKSPAERKAWYVEMLGPYASQVKRSATCHGIPPQLLATVILNELADIDWKDVEQQRWGLGGSLGIAQIQVETAVRHGLTEQENDAALIRRECLDRSRWGIASQSCLDGGPARLATRRLTIPQSAIEAAAREIKRIIESAVAKRSGPWVSKFNFSLSSASALSAPSDIYNHVSGSSPVQREMALAEMVVAAYNSPDIINAVKNSSVDSRSPDLIYKNATIHGANARHIAADLHTMSLFGTSHP